MGIFDEIKKASALEPSKGFLKKDLEDLFNKIIEEKANNLKVIKSNLQHLEKKSIELKKPIPYALQIMAVQHPFFVSSEMLKLYAEWFSDLKDESGQ